MKGIPMDLNFWIPAHIWIIAALCVGLTCSIIFYKVGWQAGASEGYVLAKTELAHKAIAYVAPQVHQRVTATMTESATTLKTLATEIEKRTWADPIQSEMEVLAKLYRRTVAQLESHEINKSAQRFLSAATSDTYDLWAQINERVDELMAVDARATLPMRSQLDDIKRNGSYSLMSSLQFLSAALMLEENGFGESN